MKTKIDYVSFSSAIESYMSWVYTGSVLDKEKKICVMVFETKIELAVKSSNILVKQMIESETTDFEEGWSFLLDYPALKGLTETYRNLSCTYINKVEFVKTEHGVRMNLYEQPKEGYPNSFAQTQSYEYPQSTVPVEKYYKETEPILLNYGKIEGLNKWLESLVPHMKSETQMQFEKDYALINCAKVIYGYKNPCREIFQDGSAMTQPESVFLRQLTKYTKGTQEFATTTNYIVLFWGSCVAYMTKTSVRRPMYSIFKHEPYRWSVSVAGGYFEDILRRFRHLEDEITITTEKENLILRGKGIRQTMVADIQPKDIQQSLYAESKVLESCILQKSDRVHLGFVDKKSRGRQDYYVCYITGSEDSQWVSVMQIRKG